MIAIKLMDATLQTPDFSAQRRSMRLVGRNGLTATLYNADCREVLDVMTSPAHKRTVVNERFGIMQAVRQGKAATTGGKT